MMSICLVQTLWSSVYQFGKGIHAQKKPDGRMSWEMIKPELQRVTGIGMWRVDFLREFDPRKHLDNNVEDHHFLIQHFKIPSENDCTFVRLMQVK
jgi:hypothetical protein